MKKLLISLIAISCVFIFGACGAAATTSYSVPWNSASNVYEQTTYAYSRDQITTGADGKSVYTQVANGTQTVTISECEDPTYENCLQMVTERTLTYTRDVEISGADNITAGQQESYYSKIVFSIDNTDLLTARYTEKKVTSDINSDVNLDYTATYDFKKDGLTINDKKNNKTVKYSKGKISGYADNDMWYLLVRYGSKFGVNWSGTLKLISIPDTLYNSKLTTFSLGATASKAASNLSLTSLENNLVFGSDQFANVAEESGALYAPAISVTIAQVGDLNTNIGPGFSVAFHSERSVAHKIPLANVMLSYSQTESGPDSLVKYRNTLNFSGASITKD